ncbi:MAG: hypothetical protein HRU09_03560 [Oligoflexales bacterium]|nr:hypothetical protein [Oligoflexales bacterium]
MKDLDPSMEQGIIQKFREYKQKHPEFIFEDDPSDDWYTEISSVTVAKEMARETKIYLPVADSSHRKYLAPFIVESKRLLRKLARPFLKVLFVRQERMNDLTVSLAYGVASLEMRLMKLENRLKKEENLEPKPQS